MKLKNKKTGKILELAVHHIGGKSYESLAEIEQDWEDVPEEPKEYWFINDLGNVEKAPSDWLCDEKASRESIGNYFETKEEAEKAVEKLKAWKRLKDKGLHVTTFYVEEGSLVIRAKTHNSSGAENWEDLDLLFGGEE